MDVGFGNPRDADVFLTRSIEVGPDVAGWVDDDRLARRLASDQVARLRETFIVAAADQHRSALHGVFEDLGETDAAAQEPLADDGARAFSILGRDIQRGWQIAINIVPRVIVRPGSPLLRRRWPGAGRGRSVD